MADALIGHGWPTACIAGSHDQKDRNEAMSQLKMYKCRVLISTDLVSKKKYMKLTVKRGVIYENVIFETEKIYIEAVCL